MAAITSALIAQAAIAASALAGGTALVGYGVRKNREKNPKPAAVQNNNLTATDDLINEAKAKEEQLEPEKVQANTQAQTEQKKKTAGYQGRSSTILTGPLGLKENTQTLGTIGKGGARKTLLGS
jgi:uncharacterized protein HemX